MLAAADGEGGMYSLVDCRDMIERIWVKTCRLFGLSKQRDTYMAEVLINANSN